MKEQKVRIKVRLTEEEKEKLERNSALCGLTQSEYVRQLCRGVQPKPKPPDVFWQLMDELYKAHFDLKECAKFEPSALNLCAEIEQLVLDLQEVVAIHMSKILGAISFWESTVAVIFFFMLLSFSLLFITL